MQNETLYVRSVALSGLDDFIRALGGDPIALFLSAGLNPADMKSDDNFISWPKVCTLLELAAEILEEPYFGLKWAQSLPDDFQNSGPMVFLASLVPDGHSFIKLALKYHKIHTNGITNQFQDYPETGSAHWIMHLHPSTPSCRQYSEHIAAVSVQLVMRQYDHIKFTEVCFQHSAPKDQTLYNEIFKCPVVFNAPRLEIIGDRKYLDTKIGGSLRTLQPLLKLYLNRRVRKVPKPELSMTPLIIEILPSIFGGQKSDPVSVAKALGLNPKKMQRLLKDEDTNFSEIRDNVRHQMAKRLLFESDITITHLAKLLDYTSVETFNAACQRWCRLSPRAYRQYLRRPADE